MSYVESILKNNNGTIADVNAAITYVLNYAPFRKDGSGAIGGGRSRRRFRTRVEIH